MIKTNIFILILLLFSFNLAYSKNRSARLLLEYKKNGEKIKVYSWYHGEHNLVHITMINYNKKYSIIYPVKDDNCLIWLSQADFLDEQEFYNIGCHYEAINDTSNNIYSTTSFHAKYSKDSLKGAQRIYLEKLEYELLAEAIKLRITEGPEKPEYFKKSINPYSIFFFLCVPLR
jgi:hypothetical protein